jgi:methionyl-tRNA formyltransferase
MRKPSVILLGSKPGSVVALSLLLERGWNVLAVVPSKAADQTWIAGPTLQETGTAHGIPVLTQTELSSQPTADFVISYMFRSRVKQETLERARRAAVNFHAGPLPGFGGWAFYSVAILEGATEYGCTCHHMDEGFDTGPLLKVRRFPIEPSRETAFSLEQKAQAEMVRLFIDFCDIAESGGPLPSLPQDKSKMRYMRREEFEALKKISPGTDDATIDRYARAFWYPPYECAYLVMGNKKVELVPRLVQEDLATLLHARDLANLVAVAADYRKEASR